jgi:hypothetical protein
MEQHIAIIELNELDQQSFVLWQKYYAQFYKLLEKKVFEKEFTGQIVLDVLNGNIENLKKGESWHF